MARLRILTVLDRHGGAAENDSNAAGEALKAAKRLVPVKEYPLCRVVGHRRCIDNIFIERLLRSLSYDRVPPPRPEKAAGKGCHVEPPSAITNALTLPVAVNHQP